MPKEALESTPLGKVKKVSEPIPKKSSTKESNSHSKARASTPAPQPTTTPAPEARPPAAQPSVAATTTPAAVPAKSGKGPTTTKKNATAKSGKKKGSASKAKVENDREHVVYLGHLPPSFTEHPLRRYLAQFGTIRHLSISRSHRTGRARGYGFVQLSDAESATQVAKEVNGTFLDGRSLVAHVVPPSKVHRKTFLRRDQNTRIQLDRVRRLEGYQKKEKKKTRTTLKQVEASLKQHIAYEALRNKRLKTLGIAYEFDGFAKQKNGMASSL